MAFDLAAYGVKLRDYGFAPIALHRPLTDEHGNVTGCNCWKGAGCPPKNWGKHPVNSGWQSQTDLCLAPERIREEFRHGAARNIGCATGPTSGLIILDIDVGDGKPGMTELRNLEEKLGPLPPTPTVITGSDGRHFYFRQPAGVVIKNSVGAIAPGIDVRGQGGQGVLPPSLHKSGALYRWAPGRGPWQVAVAELPPPWVSLLLDHQTPKARHFGRRAQPSRTAPRMTFLQAKALLAAMLEHPLVEWACSNPDDVSREVWRGIATNLAIPALDHEDLEPTARNAFHAISRGYASYSESEADRVFDDALHSATTHGPITFDRMQQHGAPDDECESHGGSSLVHAARLTLLRSPSC